MSPKRGVPARPFPGARPHPCRGGGSCQTCVSSGEGAGPGLLGAGSGTALESGGGGSGWALGPAAGPPGRRGSGGSDPELRLGGEPC